MNLGLILIGVMFTALELSCQSSLQAANPMTGNITCFIPWRRCCLATCFLVVLDSCTFIHFIKHKLQLTPSSRAASSEMGQFSTARYQQLIQNGGPFYWWAMSQEIIITVCRHYLPLYSGNSVCLYLCSEKCESGHLTPPLFPG